MSHLCHRALNRPSSMQTKRHRDAIRRSRMHAGQARSYCAVSSSGLTRIVPTCCSIVASRGNRRYCLFAVIYDAIQRNEG